MTLQEVDFLDKTIRGQGGFGSTNKLPPSPSAKKTILQPTKPENTSNYKWNKINTNSSKVTIKLPWQSHFDKSTITQHVNGFTYTSMDTPDVQHSIPTKIIKQLSTTDNLLIGHHHLIT